MPTKLSAREPGEALAKLAAAGVERLQMLVEASSRGRLQRLLADWVPELHRLRQQQHRRLARWAIDVDPLAI